MEEREDRHGERTDRFEQRIPCPAQKRGVAQQGREEAEQTENLDQRRKKDIEECKALRSPHSDLVTRHMVVRDLLNIG